MRKMFLLIAAVMCAAMTAQAETWTSGACTVTLENGVMTVSGNGAMANYEYVSDIPWYAKHEETTKLIIEEGVTAIGDGAFYDFSNISPVIVVPEGVTYIGKWAFRDCSKVTKAYLPSTVEMIEIEAFNGCTALSDVYCAANPDNLTWNDRNCDDFMPNNNTRCYAPIRYAEKYITKWMKRRFGGEDTDDVNFIYSGEYVPQHFTHVWASGACLVVMSEEGEMHVYGNGAMADYNNYPDQPWIDVCHDIKTLIVEEGVTRIGKCCFDGCDGITAVRLPNSLREIGNRAFYYCDALKSIIFPEGLTTIGDYSFEYCTSLQWIYLPSTLEHLGEDPFHECPSTLQTYGAGPNTWLSGSCILTLDANGVMTVRGNGPMAEYQSFYDIPWAAIKEQITSVVIEDGVTAIGDYAFDMCTNLTSVTIPESVSSIRGSAFYKAGLTSVTIPAGVTYFGRDAFSYCTALSSVTLSEGLTTIGYNVFSNCSALTSITIPNSVTVIGLEAFYGSGLTSITIPEGVTCIGRLAFDRCANLTSVTCLATTVPEIGLWAFDNTPRTLIVYVPVETLEAYRASWTEDILPEQIQPIGGEGIEEVVESRKTKDRCAQRQKLLIDGELYILRDGKIFNAQGARIK